MSFDLEQDSTVKEHPTDADHQLVANMFSSLHNDVPRLGLEIAWLNRDASPPQREYASIEFGAVDFSWLVRYWLTNTDLQTDGNDPRLSVVDFCKRLVVAGGFTPGREILTMPPGCSLNTPPAKESTRARVITLDATGDAHDANAQDVDVATAGNAVVAPLAVPPPVPPPGGPA